MHCATRSPRSNPATPPPCKSNAMANSPTSPSKWSNFRRTVTPRADRIDASSARGETIGLLFKNDLLDEFGSWSLSYIPYGGPEFAEIQAVGATVGDGD